MKTKFLVVAVLVLLVAGVAHGNPFVVSDEYPLTVTQPDYFEVTLDGAVSNSTPQTGPNGGLRLHFDLTTSLPVGAHNFSVRACHNIWGCSPSVPFGFTKGVPGAPSNIRLSNQ